MNQENPVVSRYLIQNTIWWIEEAGADGLRLDTFPYVGRTFWHDFHSQLHSIYPKLTTVGEVFNGTFDMYPALNSFFAGGIARSGDEGSIDTGLDTPFDYPMYSALRNTLLHGAPMSLIVDTLNQDGLYPHPERLVPLIGSHDTKRFLSEQTATLPKLKLAFAILLTMREIRRKAICCASWLSLMPPRWVTATSSTWAQRHSMCATDMSGGFEE